MTIWPPCRHIERACDDVCFVCGFRKSARFGVTEFIAVRLLGSVMEFKLYYLVNKNSFCKICSL